MSSALLEVRDLKVHYPIRGSWLNREHRSVKAVDGVSFEVAEGETVGLVGESGSGKTTVGRAIIKLAPITEGKISWEGHDITHLPEKGCFVPIEKTSR
jgi:ABC-type oligopeptide transport system ATPase subunit